MTLVAKMGSAGRPRKTPVRVSAKALLVSACSRFEKSDSTTPYLDAEVILAYTMGLSKAGLLVRLNDNVDDETADRFNKLVDRRAKKEPVAYIIGEKEFYQLAFRVTPGVLIPRPETETLVETAFDLFPGDTPVSALEIGVGSGAIAITLADIRKSWRITAVDLSSTALAVAEENAKRHLVWERIRFLESDMMTGVTEDSFDLIICNPPYVPLNDERVIDEVRLYEPHLALYSGDDGMDAIKKMVTGAPSKLKRGGFLIFEIGDRQGAGVRGLIETSDGLEFIRITPDLAGLDRVAVARRI